MDRAEKAVLTPGRLAFVLIAVAVFVADRISKGLVNASIAPGTEVSVVPHFLWITNAHNAGAAFGLAQAGAPLFLLASIVVSVALVVYVARNPGHTVNDALLGLILGGTLGNGYERLVHGAVTDFITVHWWPVFNIADSAISVGVVLLLAGNLLRPKRAA
ncbi:MAG TPA: signal peptidase II [Candidatus Dormibacteraeota bacterium]